MVLAALTLLLCGVLALQWWSWAPGDALPGPPAASSPSGPADEPAGATLPDLDLELPPREDYASVIERPLFLPERRPPPDEAPETDEAVPELTELDGVDLTAVVITTEVVSAWVRAPDGQELKRLRLGDDFLGWTVKTIEPEELVLERQGETNRLLLRDYENAPQPIPPTRLPPRQAPDTDAGQPSGDSGRRSARAQDNDDAAGGTTADRRSPGNDAVRAASRRQPGGRPTPTRQPPRRPPTATQ
jgi:hypothetical protein